MPITKSAIKALRQSLRKAKVNKPIKSQYKTALKKMKAHPSAENLKKVYSALDKAAQNKTIHKNKASRLKSQSAKLKAPAN